MLTVEQAVKLYGASLIGREVTLWGDSRYKHPIGAGIVTEVEYSEAYGFWDEGWSEICLEVYFIETGYTGRYYSEDNAVYLEFAAHAYHFLRHRIIQLGWVTRVRR